MKSLLAEGNGVSETHLVFLKHLKYAPKTAL